MVFDIKMCRFDSEPWGFRLVGGVDFEYPLMVVKVAEQSIAEEAGLRAGDIIVRINDTPTSPLTHEEVDKLIRSSGNVFFLGVHREDEEVEIPQYFPINEIERAATPTQFAELESESQLSLTNSDDYRQPPYSGLPESDQHQQQQQLDLQQQPQEDEQQRCDSVMSENTETKLVEQEIAAVLSGESEVLKEHNVLGIFPKPGVCMASDVLRTLNAEAIKTRAEKEKETRKFTTFLQRPNRPVPKSKQQIEAERRAANAYKVKIVKSTRRSVSPAVVEQAVVAPAPVEEKKPEVEVPAKEPTPPSPEVEEPPPTDSEVPNLEEVPSSAESGTKEIDQPQKECEGNAHNEEPDDSAKDAPTPREEVEDTEPILLPTQKTEEELLLERQLADVQQQLAALASLPSAIQATLDAVTKQLGQLLPAFKLQQQVQGAEQERILENINEVEVQENGHAEHVDENGGVENVEETEKLHENEGLNGEIAATEMSNDNTNAEADGMSSNSIKQQQPATILKEATYQLEEEQMQKKQKLLLFYSGKQSTLSN